MMTEKEKMLAGELYDANYNPDLIEERKTAKDLCYDFNHLRPSDTEAQQQIMRKILGKTGERFEIIAPFYCDYGYNIEVGENFFANHNLVILDGAKVKIGDNVFIGPDCGIYTAIHPLDFQRRNEGLEYAFPVTIGNNVWIGGGVKICPGITIGENSVIGAGSVVTRDIPANVVAVGNPCRILKHIEQ